MEAHVHTLGQLFAQLGLPDDPVAIDRFIAAHRPLPNAVALSEAAFWNPAQRAFLAEEIGEDADWAPVVDTLNTLLRPAPE